MIPWGLRVGQARQVGAAALHHVNELAIVQGEVDQLLMPCRVINHEGVNGPRGPQCLADGLGTLGQEEAGLGTMLVL